MGNLRKAGKAYNKNRERWDASFANDQFKIPDGRATKIRLGEKVDVIPHHWVEFYSEKKKGKTGFYQLCLNWNFETGEHQDRGCPMCEAGIRASNYAYAYVISRAEQRKGNLQVRPVRLTPKCTNDILKLTDIAYPDEEWPEGWQDEDGPDATDPQYGFDIMISMEKNNSKTEYPVHVAQGGIKPLTKEERRAFKDYMAQVDFAELAAAGLPSAAEIKADLQRLGILEGGKAASEGGAKKAAKANYDEYDEVPEDDGDAEDEDDPVVEKPRASKKKAAEPKKDKSRKVQSLTDDEDEDDEGGNRSLPWDDEDEEDEEGPARSYATADEDDAPEDDEDDEDED